MTHDEVIEAGGMAIFEVSPDRKAGTWLEAHFQTRAKYRNLARAAIRVIAPAVLDDVAALEESRSWSVGLKAHEIRALKTRCEQ